MDSILVLRQQRTDRDMNLKIIDLTGNKQVSNECLVRFFYHASFSFIRVNISQTHATADVIIAILSNKSNHSSLRNIIFNNCESMDYPTALWAILLK